VNGVWRQALPWTGISFSVERGEVVGFLGPNVRANLDTHAHDHRGTTRPTGEQRSRRGRPQTSLNRRWRPSALIGYLPENAAAYTDMTVARFPSNLAAELRGLSGGAKPQSRGARWSRTLLPRLGPASIHSTRCPRATWTSQPCLAQALIHDPESADSWTSPPTASIRTRSTKCAT